MSTTLIYLWFVSIPIHVYVRSNLTSVEAVILLGASENPTRAKKNLSNE